MIYYLIIPAYNEAQYLPLTLQSIVNQTVLPTKVVFVNDNSTDKTVEIVTEFSKNNSYITLINTTSEAVHLPGSKVINAFNKGLETIDDNYDFIVKLDADLILPHHYFETIINHFKADAKVGMAGGFAYIEKNNGWILENLTDKDHIRGAFKAYRKQCFEQIGGLKPQMGWDTADELLAQFYGWSIKTDANLKVKHLKPTGSSYNISARYKQGEAFYCLGYGFIITAIAAAKLALLKKKPLLFFDYIKGFLKAKFAKKTMLVNSDQAKFIRKLRWKKMLKKIGI